MSRIVAIRSLNKPACINCRHYKSASPMQSFIQSQCWFKANLVNNGPASADLERGSFDPECCGPDARYFQLKDPEPVGFFRRLIGKAAP